MSTITTCTWLAMSTREYKVLTNRQPRSLENKTGLLDSQIKGLPKLCTREFRQAYFLAGDGNKAAIMRKFLRQLRKTIFALAIFQLSTHVQADEIAFREATVLYQQSQWQRAAKLFTESANDTSHPADQAAARFYRGECLMQLGDYASAQLQYQAALEQPLSPLQAKRALFRSGEVAWFLGDAEEAKKLLSRYVEEHGQEASATYAKTYLSEINATIKLTQGRSYYDSANYELALAAFREIPNQTAVSHVVQQSYLAAGWSLWKLERFAEIQEELQPLANNSRWRVEYHYLLGLSSYAQQDWLTAITHLKQSASNSNLHTNADAIVYYLGECCLRAMQSEAATRWFRRVIDRFPNSKWAVEAQNGLEKITRSSTTGKEIQTSPQPSTQQLVETLPTTDSLVESLESKQAAVTANELSAADKLLDEAAGLERDGRFDPALAAYHELLEKYPTANAHQGGLLRAAQLHSKLSQHAPALALYKEYLATYSNSKSLPKVLAELAWLEERVGNVPSAAKFFGQLQAEFPQSAQAATAAYWLALHTADKKEIEQAHRHLDWLLEHHVASAEKQTHRYWEQAVCLKCQLAASANDWQAIQNLLGKISNQLNEEPTRVQAAFWLAEAQFRTGNYQQARIAFEKLKIQVAGITEPWVAMVPLRRAQLAARRQQWTEALKRLNELDQQHPQFELDYEVDYLRGRALAGRAEMSSAREAYSRVLANPNAKATETAAMAQWMIGESYFHQYDYARAREVYLKVIDQHTQSEWQARAALQAGKCWELEGQWEKAKSLYTTALKRWGGSESEKQLQARLKWADSQVTKRL